LIFEEGSMKYVVMQMRLKTMLVEIPFVFPDLIVHSEFVKFSASRILKYQFPGAISIECISAGFVNSMDLEVCCTGESESLRLKSRPEDSNLIRMCDYGSMNA